MADIELALELNTEVGDELQHRRLLAAQGWFDFAAGRRTLGLERIRAAARPPAVPDPLGDAYIAMVHSDVLLEVGAPASEVATATEQALRLADELHIDSQLVSTARSNTAEAWLLAGDVERAAHAIGAAADGDFRHERWALHLTRAEIDIARGDLVGAQARLDEIMTHQLGAQASQDYLGEVRTKLLLWRGRPVEAWECARAVLDRWASAASHVARRHDARPRRACRERCCGCGWPLRHDDRAHLAHGRPGGPDSGFRRPARGSGSGHLQRRGGDEASGTRRRPCGWTPGRASTASGGRTRRRTAGGGVRRLLSRPGGEPWRPDSSTLHCATRDSTCP